MVSVLFVCLGNICRSPMAEAVFRNLVRKEGLLEEITIDSAGTGDWHIGHPPHEGTRELLDNKGISYEGMFARQIAGKDVEAFDYIVAMDVSNEGNIRSLTTTGNFGKIRRLLDYVDTDTHGDVPDPYYSGNFEEVYEMIHTGCEHLLAHIKKNDLNR